MNILVINCGSSSLKYQLIDMNGEKTLAKGLVERINIEGSRIKHETIGKEKKQIEQSIENHDIALRLVMDVLIDPEFGAISSLDEINAVGHRVVHGGEFFSSSVIIDGEVLNAIEQVAELAPLHNIPNLIGITACKNLLPNVKQVAVFDTAFHQTMPAMNYIYAIPYEYYENYKIRRYGFHGTSHKYVSLRASQLLGKDISQTNVIVCHLGNGSSICAVKNGKSYDTSMGFTPLEGVPMGTRSGNIDPAIVPFIMEKENISTSEIKDILNKKSGVLGVSGISSDFRDLEEAEADGNNMAGLAIDIFENAVKKYIGAYMSELGEVDAIIFTAGVGENSASIRKNVIEGMESFGIKINDEKNNIRGKEAIVSEDYSKVKVMVIPTNEELMIARDTLNLVK